MLALLGNALVDCLLLGLHLDFLSLVLVVALGLVSTCFVDGSDVQRVDALHLLVAQWSS